MVKILKFIALLAVALAVVGPAARPAEARVFVGVGIGVPLYPGYYPPPVYYPPPPVYYAPPPVIYTPPAPVYVTPPAPAPAAASNCRTYNGDATIDASGRPFYGTACMGPDGRWHIQ